MDSPGAAEEYSVSEKIFKIMKQMELLAEDILADKRKMIELDKRRQKNREALRALKKPEGMSSGTSMVWCVYGSSFVRTEKCVAEATISAEQADIENELEASRKRIKKTMQELRLLEGSKGIEGFDLQPLSREEKAAIHTIIGAT